MCGCVVFQKANPNEVFSPSVILPGNIVTAKVAEVSAFTLQHCTSMYIHTDVCMYV